ncbi:lantibiotic dehydratase [Oceanobacillus alkalisoli]|uniref:lantibiotic dehydratase n=1 Tax=Oceanobacillus alkalisoli TaxID=2925113 RepID=UPI001EE3D0DD|nr:lantibiotic dehydratase [Oceanobacillus alkalisoli]MCG5103142.1 lantibiotic dehydratase [Oceanobacillus alkalisoli]
MKKNHLTSRKSTSNLQVLDRFMVRTPFESMSYFFNHVSEKFLNNMSMDEQLLFFKNLVLGNKAIKEIISVSSPSLYFSIERTNLESRSKDKRNVIKGVFRYLNRISTRTTPFGLCASVGIGTFHHEHTPIHDSFTYRKKVQVDMEWAHQLVKLLQSDVELIYSLDIKVNGSILAKGNRAKLAFSSNSVKNDESDISYTETTINYNKIIQDVVKHTKNGIPFLEMLRILSEKNPGVEEEIIIKFLFNLIQQEFLITNLELTNTISNPLKMILTILEEVNYDHPLTRELKELDLLINEYEELEIGKGLEFFHQLTKKMRKLIHVKDPLKIDLITEGKPFTLSDAIKENIEDVTNLLCQLTALNGGIVNHNLQKYHNLFLEQYGLEREVPLIELLDNDIGIGAPNSYTYPPNPNNSEENNAKDPLGFIDNLFIQWITETFLMNKNELELTKKHIDVIRNLNSQEYRSPDSLDMFFTTIKKGDQTNFVLGANPYANGAGSTIGRFINYFPEAEEYWSHINEKEKELHPDALLVEVTPATIDPRNLNVCQIKNRRDYTLNIVSNYYHENHIELSDVVVGSTHDSLYLKSKKLQKEIIPVSSHRLNPDICSNIYRFLIEVGMQRMGTNYPYFFSNIISLNLPALPRITYKNIILSRARWTLHSYMFKKQKSFNDFSLEFSELKRKYQIPRFVYLSNLDNQILYDLHNKVHMEDLYREVAKLEHGTTLTLLEYLDSEEGYAREIVFSFINKSKWVDEHRFTEQIKKSPLSIIPNEDRIFLPFSNWIYLKIYCAENRVEEFLGEHLYYFIKNNNWYNHFFFMRYRDPKFHIRLRFNIPNISEEAIATLRDWLNSMLEIGIINKCTVDTYDPEIERYGSPGLMNVAEQLFYSDSLLSLDILNRKQTVGLTMPSDQLAILNISHYMSTYGWSFEQQLDFLNRSTNYKAYLKDFRENRSTFIQFFNDYLNGFNSNSEEERFILHCLHQRNDALVSYKHAIEQHKLEHLLYSDETHILDSMIHLHMNRLIGIDRVFEKRAITLYRHLLYTLINQKNAVKEVQNNG